MRNFALLLDASAGAHAERPAVVWRDGVLSHAVLHRRAAGFARFLADSGVRAGDRVALSIPNTWAFAAALLGALKLGAVVAPLDPRLTDDEHRAILDDLRPRLVVQEVVGDEAEWPTVTETDAPALVLYTSGTTGRPKGAVLSHDALSFAVDSWAGPVMALTPDDVVLGVLPFSHSYGLNGALLAPLLTGGAVVTLERFVADDVLEAVAVHRVTVLPAVATMFRRLLGSPALDRARLGGVRMARRATLRAVDLECEWRERPRAHLRGYGRQSCSGAIYLAAEATIAPRDRTAGAGVDGEGSTTIGPSGAGRAGEI